MSSYLFTLTITPVQSFISQARKTRDLFAGSEILSDLMRRIRDRFSEDEIVFPQKREFVSNKIVVKLKDRDPKELGEDLEEFINNIVMNLIFQKTNCYDNSLNNFFQVFWVAVKLDEANYKESYKKLEQSLGAIKNLRIFTQQTQLKGVKKCSLCGERNIAKEDDKDKLCLVCYTKRCYVKIGNRQYPSTEDISNDKKYYALLQFDIDDMGKHLSSAKDIEAQRDLSKKLGEFAQKAKEIVTPKYTIYAGGDDFLGFVELDRLFDTIKEIKEFKLPNITFSTSIVIAHEKAPLHKVLDYSRELLATTKNHFDNKNGVGVIVMSNSAINAQTICRYDDLKLLNEMREKKIGMGLHYKLKTIFSFLDDKTITHTEYKYQIEMLEYEIKRLLKREQGDFDKELYLKLIDFLHEQVDGLDIETEITIDFDNFIGYLKTLEQLKKVL